MDALNVCRADAAFLFLRKSSPSAMPLNGAGGIGFGAGLTRGLTGASEADAGGFCPDGAAVLGFGWPLEASTVLSCVASPGFGGFTGAVGEALALGATPLGVVLDCRVPPGLDFATDFLGVVEEVPGLAGADFCARPNCGAANKAHSKMRSDRGTFMVKND